MDFLNYLLERAREDGIIKNVVGAVIVSDNKFLILSRKKDDFMGGIDELPSGNMEENENIYEALVREVKEETNLDVKGVISYINTFDYISGSGKKARQYNFFVKVNKGKIKLTEHDDYKWMSIEEVRNSKLLTFESKDVLEIVSYNNL